MAPKKRPAAANAADQWCNNSEPEPAAAKRRRGEVSLPVTPMSSVPGTPLRGGPIYLPPNVGDVVDLKVKVGVAEGRAGTAEQQLEEIKKRLAEAEKRVVSADMRAAVAEDQAKSLQKTVDRQDQEKECLRQEATSESKRAAYFEGKLKAMSNFPELVKIASESFLRVALQSQGANMRFFGPNQPFVTVKPEIVELEDPRQEAPSSHAQAPKGSGRMAMPVNTGAAGVAPGTPAGMPQPGTPANPPMGRHSLGGLSGPGTPAKCTVGRTSIGGPPPGTPIGSAMVPSKGKDPQLEQLKDLVGLESMDKRGNQGDHLGPVPSPSRAEAFKKFVTNTAGRAVAEVSRPRSLKS